ncbi:HPr family phosphocarrier protein [Candidatus Endomicrobiellum devescovinae]|jgi:phosphocarrier protein|uniref:HPr family phosphocarrier protein n=1 Tax=Candidatus Endomicrobiellum devescovinae TaxID=3242322 RepID=UPI002837180C|nr:HPr family phosphocarrier protein [Endomicrobium sp.]MDR1434488.1 HPr family phosphocarrier protein [Endomicrobium sp.]MDR2818907.1 HPr family phosphocarrier protein [Endomicrobium sp.]
MKEKIIVVSNKAGLHARPAATLVQTLSKYQSDVKILKDDFEVDAKSVMGVMALAAAYGSKLKFIADGPDEYEAIGAVETLFDSKFGE